VAQRRTVIMNRSCVQSLGVRGACRHAAVLAAVGFLCLGVAFVRAQQPPTFRSGVEVVLVDVTVVNRTGQPVGDLGPGDFTVTVDGKPRAVVSAQFLSYDTRTTTVREKASAPAKPAASPLPPPPPRNVLIVIDEDNVGLADGLAARQAAGRFVDKLAPTDRLAVAVIPRLRSQVTFSTRRKEARQAIDAFVPGPLVESYGFNIGLAEAFDAERGFSDVIARVTARECARDYDPRTCPDRVKVELRQMQLDAHLRGQRSLDALFALGEAMAGVEGPKTVLLISGGMPMPDIRGAEAFSRLEAAFAAGQASLYTLYLERSFFGQAKKEVSPTQLEDDALERDGIENATSVTGGTLLRGIGTLDQYFDRVVTEMSGSYLIGIEVAPRDRDGRTHQVDVKVARHGLEVRARKRYVIEPARAAAPTATKAAGRGERKPAAASAPVTLEMLTPEVESAVDRAGRYAAAYETALSGLVAEERYVQRSFTHERVTSTASVPIGRAPRPGETKETWEWMLDAQRETRSDYLLVKAPGGERWLPFRDVFEVDGKKVREREERLQRLFLEAPAKATDRAAEIMAEAARYNIGFVQRNVNLPTLALRFLDPRYKAKAFFRKDAEVVVAGTKTWELAFSERGSPTLVQGPSGDAPAEGTFWIEPQMGRVIRSRIRHQVGGATIEVTVTYRPDGRTPDMWVPSEMREVYEGGGRRLECVATYSKIRRFQVTVDEAEKK
jgi:VWFA-related protein